MTETRSLHKKLAQVMYEAERIPKNGTAPAAMGGFKFVQVGDAADYIRKALAEKGISMLPSQVELLGQNEHETAKGGTMTTAELRITWTLTDGDSGETAVIQSYGVGADTGDKYSGKATTNAMKYALLAGFLLSTGDDPELSDTSDRRPVGVSANGVETEELLGIESREGTVRVGGATGYKLEEHQTPNGPAFGFSLETARGNLPQVLIEGDLAAAIIIAEKGDPANLKGHWCRVKGRLFSVRQPGRSGYFRMRVTEFETREYKVPDADAPSLPLGLVEEDEAELDAALP